MIENIPTSIDFKNISRQCLVQSFLLLFKVYEDYNRYDNELITKEITLEKIWDHNEGTKRTAIILLDQATENFMKSVICETSPLLLIENKRTEWPTLPNSKEKDFDDLYTISGDSLLKTFCASNKTHKVDNIFVKFIEEIRIIRNKAAHGSNKIPIDINALIEKILFAFTLFYGKNSWIDHLTNDIIRNPLFGYYDWEIETRNTYNFLDFAEKYVGTKHLLKYCKHDLSGRKYFCPFCKEEFDNEDIPFNSKWAFLKPNTPKSRTAYCINCDVSFAVQRKKCIQNECIGNVIYSTKPKVIVICLTCFGDQLKV